MVVNHKKNFVDPTTGTCTNAVEGYWSSVRKDFHHISMAFVSVTFRLAQFAHTHTFISYVMEVFLGIELVMEAMDREADNCMFQLKGSKVRAVLQCTFSTHNILITNHLVSRVSATISAVWRFSVPETGHTKLVVLKLSRWVTMNYEKETEQIRRLLEEVPTDSEPEPEDETDIDEILIRTRQKNIVTQLPGIRGPLKTEVNPIAPPLSVLLNRSINLPKYLSFKDSQSGFIMLRQNSGLTPFFPVFINMFNNLAGRYEQCMRRQGAHFEHLLYHPHLQFDDLETREDRRALDKLAPIRELFDRFVRYCEKCFSLSQFTTVDKMLLAFRGRDGFLQYIPLKPNKYWIKPLSKNKLLNTNNPPNNTPFSKAVSCYLIK
ncbi:hypothetical protein C0J52_26860 [Blattella germanica]|nr:hypothetical protein C0J52_26860 [Blattella germanica]